MPRSGAVALTTALLVTIAACSSEPSDADRVATLEQQVDDLLRQNDELRAQLDEDTAPTTTTAGEDEAGGEDGAGGADPDGLTDTALAIQRDLQAAKITLWALSDAGLVAVDDTWSDAVDELDNCQVWANRPARAQALLENEFVTRVYRIVLENSCPEHLPLLEAAAPPPVSVAELNSTLGLVAVGWLADPDRETYEAVAAVAESLLERPLPDELSVDPTRSPTASLRELTEYPGSEDAVREILERLAIGEQYVAAEAAAATETTVADEPDDDTAVSPSPTSAPATPVTVEELNAVFGPVVQEWVITPNPATYEAMIAVAQDLLERPLPADLTDDDSVSAEEVLQSLIPYPGSDTEVISILDQLALDVRL